MTSNMSSTFIWLFSMSCVQQEKCAQYWPSDSAVTHGDITIELKREEENESYTVRDLLVTNTRVIKGSMKWWNTIKQPRSSNMEQTHYLLR